MLNMCLFQTTRRSEMPSNARSLMSSVEMAYADRVIEYNKRHMGSSSKTETLVQVFRDVSLQFNDKVNNTNCCINFKPNLNKYILLFCRSRGPKT
jgi:hypothetical protein